MSAVLSHLEQLEKKNQALEAELQSLSTTAQNVILEKQVDQLTRQIEDLEDEVSVLREEELRVETSNQEISAESFNETEPVFFSVAHSSMGAYLPDDVIRFPHVYSNVGGGWDGNTNRFTCPVSGYYLITVSLYKSSTWSSEPIFNCIADLYKGSDSQTLRFNNYAEDVNFTSSGHTIIPCSEGETVSMVMVTECSLYGDSFHQSQFSGLLVKQGLE